MKELSFFEFIFEYFESIVTSINPESFLQAFVIFETVILVSEVISMVLMLRERVGVKLLNTIDVLAAIVLFVLWKNLMVEQVSQVTYYCGCVFGVLLILGGVVNIVLKLLGTDAHDV